MNPGKVRKPVSGALIVLDSGLRRNDKHQAPSAPPMDTLNTQNPGSPLRKRGQGGIRRPIAHAQTLLNPVPLSKATATISSSKANSAKPNAIISYNECHMAQTGTSP
jgi:hypothetical protein